MSRFALLIISMILGALIFVAGVSFLLPDEDPLQKADAIIVVSGGDTKGRTLHGVELYQQGYAPVLIFSGAAQDPSSISNAKAMSAIALARGVNPDSIILDEDSMDTKQNATQTQRLAGNYKKIILVTSDYHQRRAKKQFQEIYGSDTTFISSPAKDKNWGRRSWFFTPYGWWISVSELVKLGVTWI